MCADDRREPPWGLVVCRQCGRPALDGGFLCADCAREESAASPDDAGSRSATPWPRTLVASLASLALVGLLLLASGLSLRKPGAWVTGIVLLGIPILWLVIYSAVSTAIRSAWERDDRASRS